MNKMLIIIAIALLAACSSKVDYASWKETQDYNVPLWSDSFENKTALVVFPHPDDEVVVAGTIDFLKRSGWRVNLLMLTKGNSAEKEVRMEELQRASAIMGFENVEITDLPNNSWDAVLSNEIVFWYDNIDSIENIIYRSIMQHRPSLIITYDTVFGAYGHPEHRISALSAYNVAMKHKGDSLFPVECLLQSTLTEKMEQKMIVGSEAYENAKVITGYTTLPEPTVSFDITESWPVKAEAAAEYISQSAVLTKFFILPGTDNRSEHFDAFNREYFYEIWITN
jgi:N-acetylglucosamine malate deacetylase 2